jgi:protein involved in ribonucleotide reduction
MWFYFLNFGKSIIKYLQLKIMIYKVISISGSLYTKEGLLSYNLLEESGGQWSYETVFNKPIPINTVLSVAATLSLNLTDFTNNDAAIGQYLAKVVASFITENKLDHKVDFIVTEGILVNENIYMGSAAEIAAHCNLPVVGELYKMNIALQGSANGVYAIAKNLLNCDAAESSINQNIAIALLGALRWREANNILAEHTNAKRSHIGGTLWLGVDA